MLVDSAIVDRYVAVVLHYCYT